MTDAGEALPPETVNIGVLALQGSFREHIAMLRRLPGVNASEVRNRQQLEASDGLIIPGQQVSFTFFSWLLTKSDPLWVVSNMHAMMCRW